MSFLFPQAFFLAVLLPVIVLFYLHRSRRRPMEVSSLLFWQRVIERAPQRRFLGALRNPLSLLLQLLIFLLLLAALARPEFGAGGVRRNAVIVLDARARMQADGGAVFREAANEALAIASTAGPDAEVAVLAAEGSPRIVASFSSDAKELRARLSQLSPSDAGGKLEESIALARRLLNARPGEGRLVVISDRSIASDPAAGVEEILVGAARDNLAILAFSVKPLPASPQSVELFLKVGNFSPQTREIEVEFLLDDRVFDLQKRSLAAGEKTDITVFLPAEVLRKGKGFLTARLVGSDALGADDTAQVFAAPGRVVRALLLSKGNPFLEKALAADPGVKLEVLTPEQWRSEATEGFDVVIFDDWMPDQATLDGLGKGAFFFHGKSPLDAGGNVLPANEFEVADAQSPLLWNVNLDSARLARLHPLKLPTDNRWRIDVPVKSNGEPAVVTLENTSGQRVAVTAFGTEDSNLSLRTAFPLFVSNVVHWLARQEGPGAENFPAGTTFLPKEGETVSKDPMPDVAAVLAAKAPAMTEAPQNLRKNGFYEVRDADGPRWATVNTADATESDLRESRGKPAFFTFGLRWFALPPWQWLALSALVLMLLEWRWHHRRLTE